MMTLAVGGEQATMPEVVEVRAEKRRRVVSSVARRVTCPGSVPVEEVVVGGRAAENVARTDTLPEIVPTTKEEMVEEEELAASVGKKDILPKTVLRPLQRPVSNAKRKVTRQMNASCQIFVGNARKKATWLVTARCRTSATAVARRVTWSGTANSRSRHVR